MHSKNLNRPEPGAEKVTPFKRKERKPPARRPPAGADAFLVKTEKILFLATVCAGDNDAYQSWGYIFFNQGALFNSRLPKMNTKTFMKSAGAWRDASRTCTAATCAREP